VKIVTMCSLRMLVNKLIVNPFHNLHSPSERSSLMVDRLNALDRPFFSMNRQLDSVEKKWPHLSQRNV